MAAPQITVVIPAFGRAEYVGEAVASVLATRPPAPTFELVVIKNFPVPDLDARLVAEGHTILDFGSRTYGETIARAIRAARGDVVAFLEDDDRFESTKLSRLAEVFASDTNATFFHNDYREIGKDGADIAPSGQRREIDRRMLGRSIEAFSAPQRLAGYDRLTDSVPEAHLSCTALRRDAVLPWLARLERVPIGVDHFLFWLAMASPGAIVIDPSGLTRYRRHPGNSSGALALDPTWYPELVGGSAALAREIRGLLTDHGRADLLQRFDREYPSHALYVELASPRPRRHRILLELLRTFRAGSIRRRPGRAALVARGVMFFFAPDRVRRRWRPNPNAA